MLPAVCCADVMLVLSPELSDVIPSRKVGRADGLDPRQTHTSLISPFIPSHVVFDSKNRLIVRSPLTQYVWSVVVVQSYR